ncbi:hypothetical protein LTR62_007088 [Meristemomyces frigidus]|uniref:LisH domain-containing protein n=1 Tax=Meristemomyces frigidus TaxID=1508187 RepID=A0AAN7TMN1_9PEZI|nr:hypothetical protein LTR62_007088 [Meristemomyces frigidus]
MSQHMQMSGMAGGPVGGGAGPQQMMNAGTPSSGDVGGPHRVDTIKRLNTAIYDYLLRQNMHEVARAFRATKVEIETDGKKSPNQRAQTNGAGVGDDGMEVDSVFKDLPDDLPAPAQLGHGEGPFLQDWWCQFWEIYTGYRGNGRQHTLSYIGAQRQAQKARTNMMAAGGIDPANMQRMQQMNGNMMMQNGMNALGMPNDLKRTAMQNSRSNLTPQQMQQMQLKMQQGSQMERQGSQMDMTGPRSNSPASGDQPSPKRQRIDNMQGNRPGPQGSNNVGGFPSSTPHPSTPAPNMPMPDPNSFAHVHKLLHDRGIDPDTIDQARLVNLAMQPADHRLKSVETYSASMQNQVKSNIARISQQGVPPNMAGQQGSPMNPGMDPNSAEFYQVTNGRGPNVQQGMIPGGPAAATATPQNGNTGNHALQDYQMQLMLLEQQNKKRLLMARQEQDSMSNPGMSGVGGQYQPGMSPGASQGRGGDPSPSAGDVSRGTPKMNKGMSPNSGDMAGRGSPQPGMMHGMVPEQLRQQMMANGQQARIMHPPSSHPSTMGAGGQPLLPEQMAMMQGVQARTMMPNGQQFPQGMMQQPSMTPRPQPMGPPPAPQTGGTQPSSPAQAPAPPTPSQQGAKGKAGKKDGKKGNAKKGGQTGATPASESEQPPTPTPATPITPMAPNSFSHQQNKNMPNGQGQPPPNMQQHPQQPQQQPPHHQQQQQQQQPPNQNPSQDMSAQNQPFGHLSAVGGPGSVDFSADGGLNIGDFSALEGGDVLDTFDFDTFLNNDDGGVFGGGGFADLAFGDLSGGLEAGGVGGMEGLGGA